MHTVKRRWAVPSAFACVRALIVLGSLAASLPAVHALTNTDVPEAGLPQPSTQGNIVKTGTDTTLQELRIPGDQPLPGPEERIVVSVPAGTDVRISGFDWNMTEVTMQGADLVILLQETGGVLVLEGFFATVNQPTTITVNDGPSIAATELRASLEVTQMKEELLLEPAAGGLAAGGGELFGLVQVVSWLFDRLDIISAAQAAEAPREASTVETSELRQLLAQFLIVRETRVARAAEEYQKNTEVLTAWISDRIAAGRAAGADLKLAKMYHLNAQLELKESQFRLILAVDAHEDEFGERLEMTSYPEWQTLPPNDLAAIKTRVARNKRATARRYWRQVHFAKETKQLLDTLLIVVEAVKDAYRQQFEVGQRTLLDLQSVEDAMFQTQVRLARRDYDLKTAEAWLLDADGKLSPDYIHRRGSN